MKINIYLWNKLKCPKLRTFNHNTDQLNELIIQFAKFLTNAKSIFANISFRNFTFFWAIINEHKYHIIFQIDLPYIFFCIKYTHLQMFREERTSKYKIRKMKSFFLLRPFDDAPASRDYYRHHFNAHAWLKYEKM